MEDKRTYYVYKHTFPNNKVYIGVTRRQPEERWRANGTGYLTKNKEGNYQQPAIAHAINKYKWENVTHEILFDSLTKEEAAEKEKELIRKYKSDNYEFGYNIDHGGFLIDKFSDETKRKISDAKKGSKNAMYGKPSQFRRPVRCIETGIIYASIQEASEKTGIHRICIARCCKGKQMTAGKMHWEYYYEDQLAV